MPLNLGLDFGSTTSILSVYEKDNGGLQTIIIDSGVPYIPSKVSVGLKGENPSFGVAAKSDVGKSRRRVFEAFKTLLNNEPDSDIVIQRGYDGEYTPEVVSRMYLDMLLQRIMSDRNADRIDSLVVGVPESWGRSVRAVKESDGGSIRQSLATKRLSSILDSLEYIDKYTIVFEPEGAAAFFVYNYNRIYKEEGRTLNGDVLIIDYGGGSLDITLSEVRTDADSKMEIRLLDSDGLGENRNEANGMVGSAGILYIESLIECGIREAGIEFDMTDPANKRSFDKLRATVESLLRENKDNIEEVFESVQLDDETMEELNEEPLMEDLLFKDADDVPHMFNITYGQLCRVYDEVIRPELRNIIENVLKRNPGIDIDKKNFKIGLVGGFSNFYFVRRQIWEMFSISNVNDPLVDGLLTNPEEQEKAISLGNALISSGIINLCVTSEFAIGVFTSQEIDGECIAVPYFAIKYRQEIEYDKLYYSYVSNDGDGEGNRQKQLIMSANGTIKELIIHRDSDIRHIMTLVPRLDDKTADELKNVIQYQANVAFSISRDGIISIHFDEVDDKGGGIFEVKGSKTVRLARFDDMFTNYTANGEKGYIFDEWVRLVESGKCVPEV